MSATVQIRRAADRAVTTTTWLTSRHSFSFGDHYDPANTHHELLLVSNDDMVAPQVATRAPAEILVWEMHAALGD